MNKERLKKDLLLEIDKITENINSNDSDMVSSLIERAKLYMKIERRDLALNDFKKVLSLESDNTEAESYVMMITAIDSYYYTDTYNP